MPRIGKIISLNFSFDYHRLVREEFTKSLDNLAVTVTNKVTSGTPAIETPNKYSCHICTQVRALIISKRATLSKMESVLSVDSVYFDNSDYSLSRCFEILS
jgi:hypothetical protein